MRVALVGAELEENLSIRYLRSALEQAGHEALQFAFNLPEELDATAEKVLASGAGVAGISIVFTRRAREFADLAVRLRERGFRGHLTAGGHFAAFNAENLLRDVPAFDSIVVGEGEGILRQLVEKAHDLASVEGLVWRDERGEVHRNPTAPKPADLDTLPWPVRKLPYDLVLGIPIVNFLASRGCAYTCHFCSIAAWQGFTGGARLRMRAPEEVAEEMSKLYEDGIRIFNFHDDNFLLGSAQASLRRLNRIQEELARRRLGRVALAIKARPDEVHYDVFARLKEMGLFRVFLGVEAGTSQALLQLGRGQEIEDNERALAIMRELDLHACFNLLLWNPDSTLEDVALNAGFLGRQTFHPLNFCRTEIYSGTPLESRLRQEGRLLGDYWGYDYVMRSPGAEESFVLAHRVFRERTHGATSLQHWAMMVDYHHQLLAHFGGSDWRLRRRVKRYVAGVNRDTSRKLLELIRAVERGAADETFVRDLRTQVRETNGRLTVAAAKILEEIHDRAADLSLEPAQRVNRPSGWGLRATAAGVVATLALSSAACNEPKATSSAAPEASGAEEAPSMPKVETEALPSVETPPPEAKSEIPANASKDRAQSAAAIRAQFDRAALPRIARMVKPRDYEVELVIDGESRVTGADFRGRGLTRAKRARVRELLRQLRFDGVEVLGGRYVFTIRSHELAAIYPPVLHHYMPQATEEAPEPLRDMDE